MPSGGGHPFPTEGYEERIRAAIAAHPVLMRTIGGLPMRVKKEETEHEQ